VKLPAIFKKATPVNLRGERTGEKVGITGSELKLNLRAYSPSSWLLE
jgi:hypothetical protein